MCLVIDVIYHPDFKPLIAERDTTCYKILFTYGDSSNKKYMTPYMMTSVQHNTLLADRFQLSFCSLYKRVTFGIHSFQNRNIALIERNLLNIGIHKSQKTNKFIVKKAIIPKGTKYWIGKNDEYCSEKIIIKDL